MEVLILSKTHMGSQACVGGMVLETSRFVRLMTGPHQYQPGNTELEVGQIWSIEFTPAPDVAPHNEDVIVIQKAFLRVQNNLPQFLKANCEIWKGDPSVIFNGLLQWTSNGSGFLRKNQTLPANSVGFWSSDKNLTLEDSTIYNYPSGRLQFFKRRRLKYAGYADPLGVIPAGTIIRVSLAKWWVPQGVAIEERCYLQLSGWY
jgi:hypothetical protein